MIVTRIDTPDKQSAAGQVPQLQSFAVQVPLDFPAVNAGDEESEEEAEARLKQLSRKGLIFSIEAPDRAPDA